MGVHHQLGDVAMHVKEAPGVGPLLPDGRQSLVLVSDDNFNRSQTTRVVVLAVARDLL